MNQFIALTCFAVCFCINKLERKKKITLGLSPENRAFIALPAGAVASKKKVHLWSPFLSMPPEGFMILTLPRGPLCLGNPCIREAQDEPPSQEAQDREHAEQAQIGEQVEKQLSSPSISPSSAAHVAVPSTALTTPSRVKSKVGMPMFTAYCHCILLALHALLTGIPKKEKKTGSLYDDPNHDMTPAANSGKQQVSVFISCEQIGLSFKLHVPRLQSFMRPASL